MSGKQTLVLYVEPSGDVTTLSGGAAPASPVEGKLIARRRVGRVEPERLSLRVLFRALRFCFGDEGRVAAATRRWRCLWRADLRLSGGPLLHCFPTRHQAVEAELRWLLGQNIGSVQR